MDTWLASLNKFLGFSCDSRLLEPVPFMSPAWDGRHWTQQTHCANREEKTGRKKEWNIMKHLKRKKTLECSKSTFLKITKSSVFFTPFGNWESLPACQVLAKAGGRSADFKAQRSLFNGPSSQILSQKPLQTAGLVKGLAHLLWFLCGPDDLMSHLIKKCVKDQNLMASTSTCPKGWPNSQHVHQATWEAQIQAPESERRSWTCQETCFNFVNFNVPMQSCWRRRNWHRGEEPSDPVREKKTFHHAIWEVGLRIRNPCVFDDGPNRSLSAMKHPKKSPKGEAAKCNFLCLAPRNLGLHISCPSTSQLLLEVAGRRAFSRLDTNFAAAIVDLGLRTPNHKLHLPKSFTAKVDLPIQGLVTVMSLAK